MDQLRAEFREDRARLFLKVHSRITRSNGHKLQQGNLLSPNIGKKIPEMLFSQKNIFPEKNPRKEGREEGR